MKYIWMLFSFLFFAATGWAQTPQTTGAQAYETPGWVKAYQETREFIQDSQTDLRQKQAETPEQISTDGFSLSNMLFWDEKGISPFTGTEGSSSLIQTPFGTAQLLSPFIGTKNAGKIPLVLALTIAPGWTVDAPHVQWNDDLTVESFIPYTRPLSQNAGKPYVISAAFPFVITPKPDTPLTVTPTVTLTACKEKTCETKTYSFLLSLPATENWPSPFSSYIQSVFYTLPAPMTEGSFQISPDKDAYLLTVRLPYPLKSIDFVLKADSFIPKTITAVRFDGKTAFVYFRTPTPLPKTPLTFVLDAGKGLLTGHTQVSDIPAPSQESAPQTPVSIHWIWISLAFLIISPLVTFLFFFRAEHEKAVRQQTLHIIKVFLIMGIGLGVTFSLWPAVYGGFYTSYLWMSVCAILFIVFYIGSFAPTALRYATLTIIAPLTYLSSLWTLMPPLYVCTYLGFIACVPYIYFYFNPQAAIRFARSAQTISLSKIKLPLLLCSLWYILMMGVVAINQNKSDPVYEQDAFQTALSEQKMVLLSSGPDWCVSCTISRWNMMYVGLSARIRQQDKLVLMRITDKAHPALIDPFDYPALYLFGPRRLDGMRLPAWVKDWEMETLFKDVSTLR